ncbi:hypothetical protein D3C76_1578680 [compost metagenome]
MTRSPLQQQDGIGIVVAADEVAVAAVLDIIPGLIKQQVHRLTAHLLQRVELAAALAAAAVVQVREVELAHVTVAHQRQ